MGRLRRRLGVAGLCSFVSLAAPLPGTAGDSATHVPFTPDRWDLSAATVVDHLGRKAVMGTAFMKGVAFDDGVVECDLAIEAGARAYPGVLFRARSPRDYERIYLRPHRAPLHDDAVQYVATFNGVDSWQLYNGPGRTSGAVLPTGRWFHVRIEVLGTQARVYLDDAAEPALVVKELERGLSGGGLGVSTTPDRTAFFSDCSFRREAPPGFPPTPVLHAPPGVVSSWEVSRPFTRRELDIDTYPHACVRANAGWTTATARRDGILDISRVHGRLGAEPDAVLARTTIRTARDGPKRYWFGYSDEAAVFVNGHLVFHGDNGYRSRDASFLGIVGPFDSVALPLRKGDNEVLFAVGEASGGWGLLLQDANAVSEAPGVERVWSTSADFLVPESVAYDPATDAFYVSNFDAYEPSRGAPAQYVSKVAPNGQIEVLAWVAGLANPTRLAIRNGTLYVVERTGIAEIDIATASITTRTPIPDAGLLNDIAVAATGDLYVSDSRRHRIYRLTGRQAEVWLSGQQVSAPNGLLVQGRRLIVGTNGDGCVKAVDLETRHVEVLANLGAGVIDGIVADGAGGLLVSHNEGRILRITPDGQQHLVLDTTAIRMHIADFAYVPSRNLAVIPTFTGSRVVAYRLGWQATGTRN